MNEIILCAMDARNKTREELLENYKLAEANRKDAEEEAEMEQSCDCDDELCCAEDVYQVARATLYNTSDLSFLVEEYFSRNDDEREEYDRQLSRQGLGFKEGYLLGYEQALKGAKNKYEGS